jgi:hypothetical protein
MALTNLPNLWYRCTNAGARPVFIDEQVVLLWLCLTLLGCAFGFALCRLVQSVVPLRARKELMNFAQIGGMVAWVTPLLVCSPWSFFFMLTTVYMFGCEPFDNVLWPPMWAMVREQWALGRKVYAYWAISSLVVHFWFVGGAAAAVIGIDYPRWFWVAIYGFGASHTARLCAFHHLDRWAGWFEAGGILLLIVCVILAFVEDNMLVQRVWLSVAVAERLTHLPGALRGQVAWMRSYELWEQVFPNDPTYNGHLGDGHRRQPVPADEHVIVDVDTAKSSYCHSVADTHAMEADRAITTSLVAASSEPLHSGRESPSSDALAAYATRHAAQLSEASTAEANPDREPRTWRAAAPRLRLETLVFRDEPTLNDPNVIESQGPNPLGSHSHSHSHSRGPRQFLPAQQQPDDPNFVPRVSSLANAQRRPASDVRARHELDGSDHLGDTKL